MTELKSGTAERPNQSPFITNFCTQRPFFEVVEQPYCCREYSTFDRSFDVTSGQRCLRLADANRASCMREGTSFETRTGGEAQLSNGPNLLTSPRCFPARTEFGFETTQSCNSISHSKGAKPITNTPTLSFRRPRKTCRLNVRSVAEHRPHISSQTGFCLMFVNKHQCRYSHMRIRPSP